VSLVAPALVAQGRNFRPVTKEMLLKPDPGDWLMFSRTYDSQRYSPLDQINRQNVSQLRTVWVRGMGPGIHENIPVVHDGVMYVVNPQAVVQALDATNGDLIWEYRRKLPDDLRKFINRAGRNRVTGIYEDMIYFAAPDGYIVALDARTGKLRWETKAQDYKLSVQHTAGVQVVNGKVISGRGCSGSIDKLPRSECSFIVAHDAMTGKEAWRFYTTAAPGEPGGDTWGSTPLELRQASPWGTPGSYDPQRNLLYWGVANPKPHTRWSRHNGNPMDIPQEAPAELYSDSTLALNPDTGKLVWYYQHLPGDDWDSDYTHDRVLFHTRFDPKQAKWHSTRVPRGQERDALVTIGEPGGLFVLDRATGEFLWASPFPYDTPNFHLSRVDGETGKTHINWNLVMKSAEDKQVVCFSNTKSYPPMAYNPTNNSIYVPYIDICFDRKAKFDNEDKHVRDMMQRPGGDPNALGGLMKINMESGEFKRLYSSPVPGDHGAVLATAGQLVFWGDQNRRFRAFDADSGKVLWETVLGGAIENSTITYAVNGKQYIAVLTGDGTATVPDNHTGIYVFALP
jgi:alcohol dehydrogenase (cytochrome c)